ncbi:MAG: rhodanese-like domain-containing protein [Isosphaeraceae bacterium]
MAGVTRISATDLALLLKSAEEVIVLDVRQPDERAFAAIPIPADKGDLFIPLGELTARLDEVKSRCSETTRLAVYCHHGVRSLRAGNWLAAQGIANIMNVEGGIDAWSAEVDQAIPRN